MADLYQPANSDELEQRFLRDVGLAARQVGIDDAPVGYGSDFWLTGKGLSGMCLLGFRNIALSESDQDILHATGEALDAHRIALGLAEVPATAATGKLIVGVSGATTIPNGQAFIIPNGETGKFVGTYVNPSNGAELNVQMDNPGKKGNLKAGQKVRLIGPPINVSTEAEVSRNSPLTGGTDAEDDTRKRDRILNTLRNKPAGGNWAYIRAVVLDNNGGVYDVYIYPALGGPASLKVVPVKDIDLENLDFSRALSDTALASVRASVQAVLPVGIECVVQTSADQLTDFTMKFTIPDSSQSGGIGPGWLDAEPWPILESGDSNKVTVSSATSTFEQITVTAQTAEAPLDGQTHIAWWSKTERKFYQALIISHSGSAGAWVLGLDRPLVDKTGAGPAVGDYVCPASQNLSGYGDAWVQTFRSLGPGENTSDTNRLPRARRHPSPAEEDPYSITNSVLKTITVQYPEITDFSIGYSSATTPTVPASTALPPNILIPRHFAIYKL
jgi:hypothetical protein